MQGSAHWRNKKDTVYPDQGAPRWGRKFKTTNSVRIAATKLPLKPETGAKALETFNVTAKSLMKLKEDGIAMNNELPPHQDLCGF
ncbi:hypothetical protein RB195_011879 [Necator americanus]|uniref:Uncharacterized protein n=1 Tax=Necator americanus TaxID=51031 RepID=A0ABR1D4M6_NECAM